MINEKDVYYPEKLRLPDIARQASDFLSTIETATPETPAPLEAIAGGDNMIELLYAQLENTDELYARHDELFGERDFERILDLTKEVQANVKYPPFGRTAKLGVGVMQYAEAGARLAADPHAVNIGNIQSAQNIEQELVVKSASFVDEVFSMVLADRIRGNMQKIPIARIGYPGFLLDAHFAFWKQPATLRQLTPELYEQVQKVFLRSSTKTLNFDAHSFYGRPERGDARANYINLIQIFQKTLQDGEAEGVNAMDGVGVITPFIFELLDTAHYAGYSPDECLQIAVQNSAVIGRLSERTRPGLPRTEKGMFHLEDSPKSPQLTIDFPESNHNYNPAFSSETKAKLQRRDEQGGICPVRHPVQLNRNGEVYKNVQVLIEAVKDRIGVSPPLLKEINGNMYVNPAALVVNYILLVIADNYHS